MTESELWQAIYRAALKQLKVEQEIRKVDAVADAMKKAA